MKKMIRRISGFLLAAVLLFAQSLSVLAGEVTYKGNGRFEFGPGTDMSDTTLFENFENAMPGDVLTQEITVKNNSDASDYIKVYLQAVPHDEDDNPLETHVKDSETVESMLDFLKQLSMTVTNDETGDEIFNASPDQTDGLTDKVYLGSLQKGETLKLTAELSVPINLGNEYAGRAGEVDWVFTVEELNSSPSIKVEKTVASTPADGEAYKLGEKIGYEIKVTNNGDQLLLDVVVKDDLTGSEWTVDELAEGASQTFSTEYTVTEADIIAGSVENTAAAKGTPENPDLPDVEDSDTVEVTDIDPSNPHITVAKTVTSEPAEEKGYQAGEKIEYEITVTNDGNLTLKNVEVEDDLTGGKWTVAELAIGASQSFTTEYTVTEADVINGSVKNVATATAENDDPDKPGPDDEDEVETPTEPSQPHMTLDKTVTSTPENESYYVAGEVIEYKITVVNDGNLTLKNIEVKDELVGLNEKIASLAPGTSKEFTTSYVVTEADMLAGGVKNVATATAATDDPDNPEIPDEDETFSPTDPVSPHASIKKAAVSKSRLKAGYETGETVKYEITVVNDGNITLHNLTVTDSLTGDKWTINELAIGASVTFKTSYKATEKDTKQGTVKNTATVMSDPDDPAGPPTETDTVIVKTVPKSVDTGDTSNPVLWISFMGIAAGGLSILIAMRRKQSKA